MILIQWQQCNNICNIMNPEINLNLQEEDIIKCSKCGSDIALVTYKLYSISAVISPTGKKSIVPMQYSFECTECGAQMLANETN